MLKVADIRVRSFSLSYLDVFWRVSDTPESAMDYEFYIQRSPNETGPFVDVAGPLIDGYQFRDSTVRGMHSMYHKLFYRIRVVSRATAAERIFPDTGLGVSLAARPDLQALEMARMENLRLKEFKGREVLVFPKRNSGSRCSACFDPVHMRKTHSNCHSCFGTGFAGGYWAPVRCYMQVITPNDTTQKFVDGAAQVQVTQFNLGNYPLIKSGDLVVEMENVRWIVGDSVTPVSKGRAMVRQTGSISRANNSSPEYNVPVNLSITEIRDMVPSPDRNFTNPKNLGGVGVVSALEYLFGSDKV